MARTGPDHVDQMRREVERALSDRKSGEPVDAARLLPMLARLARVAPERSEAWVFAHRHLAELGVERDPWRASLFARRVIDIEPDDDGAWAILGLAQSLLGHHRFAARAYERALSLAPHNPWYAHNLGHLYDVALNRPEQALPLLCRATDAETGESEIAASYAHALARCGKVAMAKRVLKRAIRHGATADQASLWRWLEAGAPPRGGELDASDRAPSTPTERPNGRVVRAPSELPKKRREAPAKVRRRAKKRVSVADKTVAVDARIQTVTHEPEAASGDLQKQSTDKQRAEKSDKKARRERGSRR